MITDSITPSEWTNHKYNGNGSYSSTTHYINAAYKIRGEIRSVKFDGSWSVVECKWNASLQKWVETEITEQIYPTCYCETISYTRRATADTSDGATTNINYYDVSRLIINLYFINTSMFIIRPPDWTPPPDSTATYYKLKRFPTITYTAYVWEMVGDTPTIEEMPDEIEYTEPMPLSQWRIAEGYNDGFPFNELIPDIKFVPPFEPRPVKQRPYITVYDSYTPQNGFDTHGMWVLTPTKCTITEALNGKYELSMEHPIDPEGRWEYIRENNIIKAMGQLFTIRVVNQQWKGNSGKITCRADHIFYQLSDRWIERDGARNGEEGITGSTVSELLRKAGAKMISMVEEGHISYTYTNRSNLTVPLVLGAHKWEFLPQGMTPVEFLMGSSGVMEASGGELHRDNFYFSLYERKEGAVDNAFEIRVGKNLTGIKRTIDLAGLVTYVSGWNNYGYFYALSWNGALLRKFGTPHHVIREKDFEYKLEGLYAPSNYEVAKEMLKADIAQYFKQYCAPMISYDIDLAEVKNNSDYSELQNLGDYKVGNKGYIYDERIGKVEIEITQTTTDAMTGSVLNVLFGSQRDMVQRPAQTAIIDLEPDIAEEGFQVMDSAGFLCVDSDGFIIVEYEGV